MHTTFSGVIFRAHLAGRYVPARCRFIRRLFCGFAVALFWAHGALAEPPNSTQVQSGIVGGSTETFDIISIKPSDPSAQVFRFSVQPGRFTVASARIEDLLEFGFNVKPRQIIHGSKWVGDNRYDIQAIVAPSAATDDSTVSQQQLVERMRMRVQTSLESRFGLIARVETRSLPVLKLVPSKHGITIISTPPVSTDASSKTAANPPSLRMSINGKDAAIIADHASISSFVLALSGRPEMGGRVLVDATGLHGLYSFSLKWQPASMDPMSDDIEGVSLFAALDDQLGLSIQRSTASIPALIIDQLNEPSPN